MYVCMYVCVYMCVYIYIFIFIGTDRPSHKLLQQYVVNKIAKHWHTLGKMLLKEELVHTLLNIEENYPRDVQRCCSEMFECWLRIDTEATWDKLITALKEINQYQLAAKIEKDVLKGISLIT